MADTFTGEAGKKKADGVADAINKLLQNLVIRCAKEEGVRRLFPRRRNWLRRECRPCFWRSARREGTCPDQ